MKGGQGKYAEKVVEEDLVHITTKITTQADNSMCQLTSSFKVFGMSPLYLLARISVVRLM